MIRNRDAGEAGRHLNNQSRAGNHHSLCWWSDPYFPSIHPGLCLLYWSLTCHWDYYGCVLQCACLSYKSIHKCMSWLLLMHVWTSFQISLYSCCQLHNFVFGIYTSIYLSQ